jgi:hypothetical protein
MKTVFVALVLAALGSANANATTYNLTFSSNTSISYYGCNFSFYSPICHSIITSSASFSPVTLFDGDTLNIQFQNVPIPLNDKSPSGNFSVDYRVF